MKSVRLNDGGEPKYIVGGGRVGPLRILKSLSLSYLLPLSVCIHDRRLDLTLYTLICPS